MAPSVAKKVGEGYGKPKADEELPIDINYAKLAEWLISRKKLVADWRKRLPVIQAQAAALAKDLPADLRSDAVLDYYRCQQVWYPLEALAIAVGRPRGVFWGIGALVVVAIRRKGK